MPNKPVKRPSLTMAERMALGQRLHENEWRSMDAASIALGITLSCLYAYKRLYRDSVGIETSHMKAGRAGHPPRPLEARRERERLAKASARAKAKANDDGRALVLAAPIASRPADQPGADLAARIVQLEHDLDRAHEEVETLQKLLMTVGRAL